MIRGKKNKHARGKRQTYNYKEDKENLNSRSYRLRRREALTCCSFCPIHNGENRRRRARPDKYKKLRKI